MIVMLLEGAWLLNKLIVYCLLYICFWHRVLHSLETRSDSSLLFSIKFSFCFLYMAFIYLFIANTNVKSIENRFSHSKQKIKTQSKYWEQECWMFLNKHRVRYILLVYGKNVLETWQSKVSVHLCCMVIAESAQAYTFRNQVCQEPFSN